MRPATGKAERWLIPCAVLVVLLVHGATLGLTDDEAYYWILAQRPALGYGFHPPAVAWLIWLSERLLGWMFEGPQPLVVRFPAALISAAIVALGLDWMKSAGGKSLSRGALVLLALPGIFAASWMMVPDLPLILGWMLAFVATWALCFEKRPRARDWVMLGAGVALALLSKFSGVLIAGAAGLALLLWAPSRVRWRACGLIVFAAVLGAAPALIWNARNDWGALAYQFRDRQSGGLSLARYGKFWGLQLLLAGPAIVAFVFTRLRRWREERAEAYVLIWVLSHGLVYCVQPLWADFKPHWALLVWLPAVLELGRRWSRGEERVLARVQLVYGWLFVSLGLLICHVPLVGAFNAWLRENPDPRWDVTNDMYGWRKLPGFLAERERLPVVGSRYQTASQAAFVLGKGWQVTLLPRDRKQLEEWPDLGVTEGQGPSWPRLLKPVYFVGDNRYDAGPEFPGARCTVIGEVEDRRWGLLAKRVRAWRCEPG